MKRFTVMILIMILVMTSAIPAHSIYMPPSRVKPTQEDIAVATKFFKDLKWDVSQASKGIMKITLPKMGSQYTVSIGLAAVNEQKITVDGKQLYQGSGGTVLTANISTEYSTWFDFDLGNSSTSANIALELYSYTPGDSTMRYIPGQDRIFPVIGPDGNITGWVNANGERVNEDGSPIGQPPTPKSYFSDVNSKYWAFKVINNLYELGYIKGYPNGTFKPDNNITRAEFMVMLGNVLNDKWTNAALYNRSGQIDIVPTTHWSYNEVNNTFKYMAIDDIKRIFADNFSPDKKITREEVVAVLTAVLSVHPNYQTKGATPVFEDISTSNFPESVKFASEHSLVSGYPNGTFKPLNNITRVEIAAVMTKVISNL